MTVPLLLALALGQAHAGDAALRSQVVGLLSGIEDPATEADWAALGSEAGAELLAIAKDATALPTQRGNALVALGYFPTDEARTHLSSVVRDESGESLLRRKACFGLARGWKDAAVADLSAALASADVQVRSTAARALGEVGSSSAKSALTARLSAETNASVRDAVSRALAGLE